MDYDRLRAGKDRFFAEDRHSPLPHRLRSGFAGLQYYEPSQALVFRVPVDEADGSIVEIGTSDGRVRRYTRAGRVTISVDGQQRQLTLLATPDRAGFFLPFRDATSGKETYGAGRYLDLEARDDGAVDIDFNLAYSPYCAYDDAYSCPLPPPENWLDVPIRAGEKSFTG